MKEVFISVLERCFLNCCYMGGSMILDKIRELTNYKYNVDESICNNKVTINIGELMEIEFYLNPGNVIKHINIVEIHNHKSKAA
ncbi:MAG: hypothetical protein J6D03_00485 [Clostridia bacterium]|nr:hypothetical protein [Clostridia bacterium]